MAAKNIALCMSALLVQSISGQCLNSRWAADGEYFNNNFGLNGAGLLANGMSLAEESALGGGFSRLSGYYGWESGAPGFPGNGLSLADEATLGGYNSAAALNGGGPFGVSSASYIAPNGVSAGADNLLYEGTVGVQGALPFLGTAGFGGELLTGGTASIAYGAGDGRFGITGERAGSGANAAAAAAAANGGAGFGAGLASRFGYGAGLAGTGAGLAGTALTNGLSYGAGLGDFGLAGARANSCGRGSILTGGCACGL